MQRLLILEGFSGVRLVGQSHDRGADLIAHRAGLRWLFQVKRWRQPVGVDVIAATLDALKTYHADVPVIVSLGGYSLDAIARRSELQREGVPLQLWDSNTLISRAARAPVEPAVLREAGQFQKRDYQEDAITGVVREFEDRHDTKCLVVMATGLGKTFVVAEAVRRIRVLQPATRVLVLAHRNELLLQLERAFWPFLKSNDETVVWNGYERPSIESLERAPFVFASFDTLVEVVNRGGEIPGFDLVFVDECHHAGAQTYRKVLTELRAGLEHGAFLLGATATPWRSDEIELADLFGPPSTSVDMVTGLKRGFLANIDYRMYTDNIDWSALADLQSGSLTPRRINRTLFIAEWDDAVVFELQVAWKEQEHPRAIVFCGTVQHAERMRDRINALGFCSAAAIYSRSSSGTRMPPWERNRLLSDFDSGQIGVMCTVDIFNEGIDVPDVNIVVFQRVTHSRRIFIQQLGRGLRLAPGKRSVVVLDFVSDIRRFAQGIDLKDALEGSSRGGGADFMSIKNNVEFRRVGAKDPVTESFLREWLEDVAAIEEADEDSFVLKYPPVSGRRV